MDRTLTSIANPSQSRSGSNVNEGAPHIPQNFKTGALLSDDLVPYQDILTEGWDLAPLQRGSRYILQPQPTRWFTFGYFEW